MHRVELVLRHLEQSSSLEHSPSTQVSAVCTGSWISRESNTMAEPIRVCVTGAAGQIAYSLLPHIAGGNMFGPSQPVVLSLLDIAPCMGSVHGVEMELQDCAYPLLKGVISTSDPMEAFNNVDFAILVGAFPRREGMERKDLLAKNAAIFEEQGKALNAVASRDVKVLVVGNPANTNCYICKHFAPDIPAKNFSALTRLDHNRAKYQIAAEAGVDISAVKNVFIWGNHSATQYPDVFNGTVTIDGSEKPVTEVISNHDWLQNDFITTVQKRGAAIIEARKLSSALSAAHAITDHIRDWTKGTPEGSAVSMAVASDGSYGIPEGLIFSFPVTCSNGNWEIIQGLNVPAFSQGKLDLTRDELVSEKDTAFTVLASSSS